MADLIIKSELLEAVPELTPPWDELFVAALNSQIERLAPCLLTASEGVQAEAKLIIFQAVQHVTDTPRWVRSESVGPFSVSYVTGGRGVLDAADLAALTGLCGEASEPAGALPLGSFPPAPNLRRVFGGRL